MTFSSGWREGVGRDDVTGCLVGFDREVGMDGLCVPYDLLELAK